MIVYGRNPVREALRGRRRVQRVFATERAAQEVWLGGLETVIAEPWELEERCGSPDHQGICAEVGPYPYVDADSLLDAEDALVLALDEVQDPHNLGAVIRVAEAAGCAGVVLPERRSAEVTAAVCRASAGAVEHLPVARVRNLADWLTSAKERQNTWVYGASAEAATSVRAAGLQRAGGSRAGKRGPGPSAARERDLRRARGAAEPGPGRIPERVHRGGGPGVRNLALPQIGLDRGP